MIDNLKNWMTEERGVFVEAASTIKTETVESLSTTKVPLVVAGGTVATSFTSLEAAQWSAACLSMMLAGKVLVDIWARINEIMLKKKAFKLSGEKDRRKKRPEEAEEAGITPRRKNETD